MKENALVLNEADKTLMYLVGCDEGEVTNFANMMSTETLPGSSYLDKPTKCAVFAMTENTSYLGKRAVDLQDHIEIGADDKVTGNLKYVAKFVKFNETVKAEQSGHYLFLYIPLSQVADVLKTQSVKVQVDSKSEKTFPPEGKGLPLIVRIAEGTKSIKLTVVTGSESTTRTLDVSELNLR